MQFRFANRIDSLLICIAFLAAVLYGVCVTAHVVIFSRLTGTFAIQAFSDFCDRHQQQNGSITVLSGHVCPLGIELNPFNNAQLHR